MDFLGANPATGGQGGLSPAVLRQMARDGRAQLGAAQDGMAVIGKERLLELDQILKKYKDGKRSLERRVIEAEQFWKLRHWESLRPHKPGDPEPASGWLVNVILSKHSDAVDAYPEAVCLAREEGDRDEAKRLTSILPVVLEQCGYRRTWSDKWWAKLKGGTGVTCVLWDKSKHNGLGDITVQRVDILNVFWEPGVTDIQKSRYFFHCYLEDLEAVREQHPELQQQLQGGDQGVLARYIYDDNIDVTDKCLIVEAYYKRGGRLHLIRYTGQALLYATENDPERASVGLYDHGRYPFVFDPLFPEEGYPDCGYGYVDLCRDPQLAIDVLNNCFVKSSVAASTPRWFVRQDGGINETEYADQTKPFVHYTGTFSADNVMQVQVTPMPANAITYAQMLIDEIKEVSGNRDVNNGGASASVTAASAIAALQEAGNGLSRDMSSTSYRAFRQEIDLCIELIRQFYDVARQFRILGNYGEEQYTTFDNGGLRPQYQGMAFGEDMGYRLPVFDIDVQVQTESAYTKQAYNELAIQLYGMGIFDPNNAEQALTMLEMMDFKGKDRLMQQLSQKAMMQQQLLMYQQMALALAQKYEPAMAQGLAQNIMATGQPVQGAPAGASAGNVQQAQKAAAAAQAKGGVEENSRVQKARQQAQDGAMPR